VEIFDIIILIIILDMWQGGSGMDPGSL